MLRRALLLILMSATPAAAQTVRGSIISSSNKQPIANADIVVLDRGLVQVTQASANAGGGFQLRLDPGEYYFRISMIGFRTTQSALIPIRAERTDLTFELADSVIPLSEVTARAAARSARLERTGFYERQREGLGAFVLRDEIEKRRAQRISQLLQGRAGLRLQPTTRGASSGVVRNELVMRGGMQANMRGAYCFPRVYVNGVLARSASMGAPTLALDDIANPDDIEAIEVFRSSSQLPAEYGGAESSCGVILIWTR